MRQIGGVIGNAVDVEEHRAGNMPGFEFLRRFALFVRHVPGGIHHPHLVQMRGQPFGGDQIAHSFFSNGTGMGARCSTSQGGQGRPFFAQEGRIEQLGLIAVAVVGQHGDDGVARTHVFCHADGARHIDAGGTAHAQAFMFQQVEHDGQRFFVGNLIGVVERRAFQIGGDAALADALGDRTAMAFQLAGFDPAIDRRAQRIGGGDADILVALLQRDGDAAPACRRCPPRR